MGGEGRGEGEGRKGGGERVVRGVEWRAPHSVLL